MFTMTAMTQNDNALFLKFYDDILAIVAASLNINKNQIDVDKNLSEYNLESITIIQITQTIGNVFQLNLSPANVYGHKSFESFICFLFDTYGAKIAKSYNDPAHSKNLEEALTTAHCNRAGQAKDETKLPHTNRCSLSMINADEADKDYLILLSAKNNTTLIRYVRNWLRYLEKNLEDENHLPLLAEALAIKREFMQTRLAFVVANMKDLYKKMHAFAAGQPIPANVFSNSIKQEKNQINLFTSHPAGRKIVTQWAAIGRKDKIAHLWVNGVPIDWEIFYPQGQTDYSTREKTLLDQLLYTDIYAERIPALLTDVAFEAVAEVDNAMLSEAFEALEKLGVDFTLYLFQQFDLFIVPKTEHHLAHIKTQMAISFKFDRLFKGLIYILKKYRIIDGKNKRFYLNPDHAPDKPLKLRDVEQQKDDFIKQFPFFEPHIHLLWTCLTHTIDVLSEKMPAVEVIFPKMSMHLVEPVYKKNPLADYFNIVTCRVLTTYFQKRLQTMKKNEIITVLELGAGTGGTSASLFEALQQYSDLVHYIYTDVSSGFVQYGKSNYSDKLPRMSFKPLDIEQDVEHQGFKPGSVDIIVAANVVHATKNIKTNLMNIKRLLKKNGWITLNEVVGFQTYSTLTFGLLDGWWLYEDEKDRIMHSPLLSFAQWKKIFHAVGFPEVLSLNDHFKSDALEFQDIIVAESDGHIV